MIKFNMKTCQKKLNNGEEIVRFKRIELEGLSVKTIVPEEIF